MAIANTALTLEDLPPPPPDKTGWPWTEPNNPLPALMPNGSEWPRISIVTPSYNYGGFIEETIRSVLLQGYPNLEYVIIDGGSTDNTVEVIKKYEKYLNYWVSEPDKGQTDAINKGYKHCTGELFSWLNSDDSYISSTSLQDVSKLYLDGYKFIAGRCLNVFNNGAEDIIDSVPTNFKRYIKFWLHKALPQPSVFVTTEIADKCFPLDTELYILMDYQFFLRILSHNPKSTYVDRVWTRLKYHGNNKTLSNYSGGLAEWRKIVLAESKKLSPIERQLFLLDVEDYMLLYPLIENQYSNKPSEVFTALVAKPTLLRWIVVWKLIVKSFIGKQYLAFRQMKPH